MAIFSNQASLSYSGGVTNSNVVTGELLEVLEISKTSVGETYEAGGIVTYAIQLINTGSTNLTGLTVTDNLGAYLYEDQLLVPLVYIEDTLRYFVNGILQNTPVVTATGGLTVTGLTVPPQGNASLLYQARVNDFAPLAADSAIVNTATVTGQNVCPPLSATDTVAVAESPLLTIAKSMFPSEVAQGDMLTYTFVIQNRGNTPAATAAAVSVTDTFDPLLTDIAVTVNGQTAAVTTDYAYDETTGAFVTVPGQIAIPAATFSRNTDGSVAVTPGMTTVQVTGMVQPDCQIP